ncbi:MAG: hypothetical protein ABII64_06145 [Elusimicrobiota bacterium]
MKKNILNHRVQGILKLAAVFLLPSSIFLLPSTVCAAFKDGGWGTRPLGMGGAFTALADDANSQLYNPAGIWQVEDFEATFMNAKLFTGLDRVDLGMNYFSAVMPVDDKVSVGILWANLYSQDQYREDTFALSGAFSVTNKLNVGVNLKNLSHAYTLDIRTVNDAVFASGNSKSAFALDGGAQYTVLETEKRRTILGLAVKNMNQPDVGLKTKDTVPAEIRAGLAAVFQGKVIVSPALEVSYRNQEWGSDSDKINVHAGCETEFFNKLFAARAGANMNEITIGLGYAPRIGGAETRIDYAFIIPLAIKETSGSHRVSLTLRFLPPASKFDPFEQSDNQSDDMPK